MPAVSLFGDFRLGDRGALIAFLDAHNRQHMQYARRLKLPGGDLTGPVNGDWMMTHTRRHVVLATQTKYPLASADTKILSLPDIWQSDEQLAEWNSMHNRLHQHIDRVLGIAGHKG